MASSQAQSESEVSAVGVYKGQQIIEVSRIDGGQTIIDKCPICGQTHHHGLPTSKTINKLIHKAAHCGSSDVGGYWLVYTHDTEGWKP